MDEGDVSRILENASIGHPRFERLVREALERIPLRLGDLNPLRIFLSGYQEGFASSLEHTDSEWFNIIVIDLHDLEKKEDPYIITVVAHEVAHVYLGHSKSRDLSSRPGQEEEARALVKRWGFVDSRLP